MKVMRCIYESLQKKVMRRIYESLHTMRLIHESLNTYEWALKHVWMSHDIHRRSYSRCSLVNRSCHPHRRSACNASAFCGKKCPSRCDCFCVYTCIYITMFMYVCVWTYTHTHMNTLTHLHEYTCISYGRRCLWRSEYVCIWIYMYVCVCVCVYLYIHTPSRTQTHILVCNGGLWREKPAQGFVCKFECIGVYVYKRV